MPRGLNNAPLPIQERLIKLNKEPREVRTVGDVLAIVTGILEDVWIDFWQRLLDQLNSSPFITNNPAVFTQGASIAATDFSGGGLNAGTYRVTYLAEITRAATTSSSLTVTIDWTSPEAVSKSVSGTAITGNTTSTVQSGTIMIRIGSNTPVRYSTTYASVGATTMQYALSLSLERMVA